MQTEADLALSYAQYTPPTPTRRNCFLASASAVCIGLSVLFTVHIAVSMTVLFFVYVPRLWYLIAAKSKFCLPPARLVIH